MATSQTNQTNQTAFDLSAFIEDKNLQAEEISRKPIKAIVKAVSSSVVKASQSSVLIFETVNEELSQNLIETKLENLVELHKLASQYNISVPQALELRSSLLK